MAVSHHSRISCKPTRSTGGGRTGVGDGEDTDAVVLTASGAQVDVVCICQTNRQQNSHHNSKSTSYVLPLYWWTPVFDNIA
jgi:hypothetical protein